MEDNITFTIQNPDAVPANAADLFVGHDSTLEFVFTIPTSLGITELDNGDLFTIIIPNTLLASADSSNLVDANWKVQSLTQPSTNDPNFTFVLTPSTAVQVNGPFSITFKKLQGLKVTSDEVSTQYNIQDTPLSGSTEKLFAVLPLSDGNSNLSDNIVKFKALTNYDQGLVPHGIVYLSPESLSPPIANQVQLNLAYSGDCLVPLNPNGQPAWSADDPPKFMFSFSYGSSFNDLTDAPKQGEPGHDALTSAWSFKVSIDNNENNLWILEKLDESNDTPIWVVKPNTNNPNLFTHGQGLDLIFDNIVSITSEGSAQAYFQWTKIPGYNDGAKVVDLIKQVPTQAVLSFTSPQDGKTIDPNTPVTLNWQAFAAENLKITWDSGFQSKPLTAYDANNPQLIYSGSDNSIVPDSPNTDFFLNANFDANGNGGVQSGPVVITVQDFPAPTISSFSATLEKDVNNNFYVAINWLVDNLGDDGYFLLNGVRIDGTGYNGHLYTNPIIPISPAIPFEDTFTLQAVGSGTTQQTIQATIPDWFIPVISGSGSIDRDGDGNPTLNLTWLLQQVTKESVCQLNGVPQTINADGSVNASLAITPQNPLLSGYTLSVQNPGNSAVSKTLTVNFKVSGPLPGQNPIEGTMLRDILLVPESWICLVLYTAEQSIFQLALFDTSEAQAPQYSNDYLYTIHDNSYNTGLKATLSISPDGSQIYINGTGSWFCVPYTDGFAGLLGPLLSDNQNHPIRSVISKDMSLIFAGMSQYVTYFEPVPTFYPSPYLKYPVIYPNSGTLSFNDSNVYINAICMSPDGKRVYVGSGGNGLVYFFDTDNINYYQHFGDCNLIQDITMTPNGWMYMVSCGNNGDMRCRVHALNTFSKDYNYHPWVFVGNYHDNIRVIASLDNSFVLVPNIIDNQLYVMAGATQEKDTVTFLQNVPLNQPFTAVITMDNSRIYVATNDGIQILEPILV